MRYIFAWLLPTEFNTATSEELQQMPGIGPATAQKILQMRKSYGPFKSVDDLLAIRGLGQNAWTKCVSTSQLQSRRLRNLFYPVRTPLLLKKI